MKSWLFVTASVAVLACFTGGGDGGDAGTDAGDTGLPCDVAQALSTCQACHGPTLSGGAPMALITYGDLTAVPDAYPDQTIAQRAVTRMTDTVIPMPPHPLDPAAQADIDTIQSWIDIGYPAGTCTPPAGGTNPFDTPENACTNGKGTTADGAEMRPGEACIACHKAKGVLNALFTVAGTVYPTAHESDDCNGVNVTGATITIVDANHKTTKFAPNTAGNFYGTLALAPPYTVRLQYQGRERDMTNNVTNLIDGDCNGCHTTDGKNGAPGRIVLP